ncbi:hypothetical protein [Sinosporangium siamense]|uniref:Uncharacterized protein n=1 Tax=Sinosporangium siamense TaxID=1367973 RepID=A0A919V8P8_9ACTN|nr:hypothetical protein [Sinosporangium siamense]GII96360.1 hypothetical protein Ssi02_65910 [Sinosporangium siamense]
MPSTVTLHADQEVETRRQRLTLLGYALQQHGHPARLVRQRHDRWILRVHGHTVFCGGADGVYAYITRRGVILAPADGDHVASAVHRLLDGHLR